MTEQFRYQIQPLRDEYKEKTGHKLTKQKIHDVTGMSRPAIDRMIDNKTGRADLVQLHKLVTYLREKLGRKITLDDLLPYNE